MPIPFWTKTIRVVTLFILFLAIIISVSCAPHRKAMDTKTATEKFEFLQDGKVTKDEIMVRLGSPSSTYENGRIIIYWWSDGNRKAFNIVLVFNEESVLERHSIVQVR